MYRPRAWFKVVGIAIALLVVVLIAIWCAEPTTTLPSPLKPGTFTMVTKSGGFDRVARVHVPVGYQTGTKPPLVVLLHGGGGSAKHALENDGWASKSDKEGFLVVAPEGLGALPKLPSNFRLNPALWNSGQLKAQSPRAAINDVFFIRDLLDELKKKVSYDESRVFSTGHSNGGGMTFRLAADLSERFAAIGMVAGRMAIESPNATKPLPTLYIIGTEDPLMPMNGGEVKSPWGNWINQPVVDQLTKWAAVLGCEKELNLVSNKDEVQKLVYLSKSNGPTLTVLYLEGHGHHWPGAKRTLSESVMGPIKSKMNATDILWDFFKSVPEAK